MVEQVNCRYLSNKRVNKLANRIKYTDYYDEDGVFDLGVELCRVGRELMCKCIGHVEDDVCLTDVEYFQWFRH